MSFKRKTVSTSDSSDGDTSSDGESSGAGGGAPKRQKLDSTESGNNVSGIQHPIPAMVGRIGLGGGASRDSSSDESTHAAKEYNNYSGQSMLMMKKW